MNYEIKSQGMICGSAEAEVRKYKKIKGKSGRYWYIAIQDDPANNVYVSPHPSENVPGYKGFRGFGGRSIKFILEDGNIDEVKGPWHSNSDSLFNDTGYDIRDKHLTFGVISRSVEPNPDPNKYMSSIMKDVIYIDDKPTIGEFDRIKKLAQKIANEEGLPVQYYSESKGGSIRSQIKPSWLDIADKIKNE